MATIKAALSKYNKYILVSALYLFVALIMFYPITLHINKVISGTGGDAYLDLWDIWWTKFAVFNLHTSAFFTPLLFWPLGNNLAVSAQVPLSGIISASFQTIGIIFSYNVIYFLGFLLSGLGMFILADYLTKNGYAAAIAGFAYTFSAFHIGQSTELVFINIAWAPLFLFFLIRLIKEDKGRHANIVGMAATFALSTLMGDIQQTMMLFLVLILILLIYLCYKETRKKMLKIDFALSIVLFFVIAFILGSWNYIPLINAFIHAGGSAGSSNSFGFNLLWSINPISFFVPSYYNGLFYKIGTSSGLYSLLYFPSPSERVAFVGFTVLILALFAIVNDKKSMAPWIVGAFIFMWLSIGPAFGLYQIYHAIPALNVIREPGRFDMITSMFIAILAAYGATLIFNYIKARYKIKLRKKVTYIALIVILALMFIENNGLQIGNSPNYTTAPIIPSFYYNISNMTGNFSVLELPAIQYTSIQPTLYIGEATFFTSITHKPTIGGYVSRENFSSAFSVAKIPLVLQSYYLANGTGRFRSVVNENYTNQTLFTLRNYSTKYVILHKLAYNLTDLGSLESYMDNVFGTPVYSDNMIEVFDTTKALDNFTQKSYVAYPVFFNWTIVNPTSNANQSFWMPGKNAQIIVYSPYQNATISFSALSNNSNSLYIIVGANKVASFNLTKLSKQYSANIPLAKGIENNIYFLAQNSSATVQISNITFSK